MNVKHELWLCDRLERLKSYGWTFKEYAGRVQIVYPERIRKELRLNDDARLYVASNNLEGALCAAEAVSDFWSAVQISLLSNGE